MNKGWATYGPLTLKMEWWDPKKHGRMAFVPSYGGWIKLRNFPLHLWNEEVFKRVGDKLGGFIEFAEENSSLINCLEVNIKVRENYCGFIPTDFELIEGPDSYLVQVTSFQDPNLLIDKVAGIHGSFSPEQAENFFKGPGGPDPNPIDIWRVEKSNSRLAVFAFQNSELESTATEEAENICPSLQTDKDIRGINSNLPPKQTLMDLTKKLGLTNEVGFITDVGFPDLKGKGIAMDEVITQQPTNIRKQTGLFIRENSQATRANQPRLLKLPKPTKIKFAEKEEI